MYLLNLVPNEKSPFKIFVLYGKDKYKLQQYFRILWEFIAVK